MDQGPSLISLTAAGLYVVVALVCVWAAGAAAEPGAPSWHRSFWAALTLAFALMVLIRVLALEEPMRDFLRDILKAQIDYDDRRSVQRSAMIFVGVPGVALAIWLARKAWRGSRRRRDVAVKLAGAASFAFVGLWALRFISLHAIDDFLYGPLKLNWSGDIGASLAILGCAFVYARSPKAPNCAQQP